MVKHFPWRIHAYCSSEYDANLGGQRVPSGFNRKTADPVRLPAPGFPLWFGSWNKASWPTI